MCRPLYILFNEVSLSAFPVLTFKLKFAAPHVSYLKGNTLVSSQYESASDAAFKSKGSLI